MRTNRCLWIFLKIYGWEFPFKEELHDLTQLIGLYIPDRTLHNVNYAFEHQN